ncbi:transcriptional regulator [Actinoplanes philippinensis]|uniref:Cell envelope-related function transcriptional attenuator common domain-containing protein n=2 Tax=Actinoplanes philippinensis TaxID=35752 RepID=A0A1I2J0A6_9ACTN|nr:transcriptional regulator [Actinoplanes philippinensis]SFF47889.1 cell envelope-related function transcriptional attenuator common domain-containing protein [Actinoplanes philippinensis]
MWARLCAGFGCVLMVSSGGVLVTGQALVARYTGQIDAGGSLIGDPASGARRDDAGIKGPLNILLAGIDPRDASQAPRSDSIIVAHVPASMDQVFLFSIPRDLYVQIPAFSPTGFLGTTAKINSAMSFGSDVGNGTHDVAQGFQLLASTVSAFTGINGFDAGAIINFGGFKKIVDAMGGVTMTIDQNVRSEHLQPDGTPRPKSAGCAGGGCDHPYIGPQKVYKKGTYHLQAWEALDYVRQRYGLPNGDYDRQRHQQQFIKAMAEQAMSRDVVTDPAKLLAVLDAAGDSLTFDGGGDSVIDWGLALKGINTADMTLIKLPGGGLFQNGAYLGEQLDPSVTRFFQAVAEDRIAPFLLDNPTYVAHDG